MTWDDLTEDENEISRLMAGGARTLDEFIAYDAAMCQCEDICKCPGYEVEDE